ncbi:MAG: purine-nucleoside phosphorylase [Bacteroidaceae bacterium]|nr:purine-nucleoside phosphorylase [Bacteroidaceae bacterium]
MAENYPTPHNAAKLGDIAETVIMSGDPLRAKFMAENYIENPVQFNGVRGMLGYTGTHNGKPVSVMGHGMGIPSIAIYTYELFNFYNVKTIIRVGTAGCIQPGMKLGDIVFAQAACTNSNYLAQYDLPGTFAPIADFGLLNKAVESCRKLGYGYKVGNVLSSDIFYDENEGWRKWQNMGVLAIEMEATALYSNAIKAGKQALCILTVSDSIVDGTATSAEERQRSFTHMMDVAFSLL